MDRLLLSESSTNKPAHPYGGALRVKIIVCMHLRCPVMLFPVLYIKHIVRTVTMLCWHHLMLAFMSIHLIMELFVIAQWKDKTFVLTETFFKVIVISFRYEKNSGGWAVFVFAVSGSLVRLDNLSPMTQYTVYVQLSRRGAGGSGQPGPAASFSTQMLGTNAQTHIMWTIRSKSYKKTIAMSRVCPQICLWV